MYIVLVAILSVALVASLYVSYNLYTKNVILIAEVQSADKDLYAAINLVAFIRRMVAETYAEMKLIDKRGGFSSDDEVGIAFRSIYECVQQANVAMEYLTTIKENRDKHTAVDAGSEKKEG